jgi:hypothetical protein
MRYLISLTLLLTYLNNYGNVYVTDFPKTDQIFQRDLQDSSAINAIGTINSNVFSKLTLKVLKDGVFYSEQSLMFSPNTGVQHFSFNPKIKAGKFDYTFILMANDVIETTRSERVVSGDVILFYGQSNAIGFSDIDAYVPPNSPFVRILLVNDINNYQGGWRRLIDEQFAKYSMGQFPFEVVKYIIANNQYPIGVIQAAVSGNSLLQLKETCGVLPPCTVFPYDRMLRQLTMAGVQNRLKYMIFRQGENECGDSIAATNYEPNFAMFYSQLIASIPSLEKIYLMQLNLLVAESPYLAVETELIRDFQRRAQSIYSKISSYASVGITGFEGVHYSSAGHTKAAQDLSKLLSYEIYHTITDPNAKSPALKKIFRSPDNSKIVLKFDEGQQMIYPSDSSVNSNAGGQIVRRMKDFIYLDGNNTLISGGSAASNYVYLDLSNPALNPAKITYMPHNFSDIHSRIYNGVTIKNTMGMRALTFARQDIYPSLDVPILSAALASDPTIENNLSVNLSWTASVVSNFFHIEKSIDGGNFSEVGTSNSHTFIDTQVLPNHQYRYKIWSESNFSESAKSTPVSISTNCPQNLFANLSTSTPSTILSVNHILNLTGNVNVPNLAAKAGNNIVLKEGFKVENAVFSAQIAGCQE